MTTRRRSPHGGRGLKFYGLDVMALAKALVEIAGIGTSFMKLDWFCDNSPADTRAANSTQNIEKDGKYGYTKYILNYLAVEPRGFLLHRQRLAEPSDTAAAVVSTGIGPSPSTAVPSVEPFPAPGVRL